ncbi:MAG: restriction endonuclease subunit S [Fimbriimonadaceae bacterium]
MNAEWGRTAFEDCIEKVVYTQKIQRKDFLDEGAFPVVSQEEAFINGYWNNEQDLFKIETPVVVFGDHTKVLKLIDFDFVLGADGVKILQPREFLVPKFFYYQLLSVDLDSLGYARHYKLLKDLDIVYPDLPEQKRIVGILDKAFEGIAIAKANAETNLQNAQGLFDSCLNSVFAHRGNGWESKMLGEILQKTETVNPLQEPQREFDYIDVSSVSNKTFQIEATQRLKGREAPSRARKQVRANDVIFATIRPTLQRIAIVPGHLDNQICSTGYFVLRPISGIDHRFVFFSLFSESFTRQMTKLQKGANYPAVTDSDVKAQVILVPSFSIQQREVARLESLFAETKRLKSVFLRKLDELEALKKSLLHQAFKGAL